MKEKTEEGTSLKSINFDSGKISERCFSLALYFQDQNSNGKFRLAHQGGAKDQAGSSCLVILLLVPTSP